MDWLDRPIEAGDPFVPLTRCVVKSESNAWLFESDGTSGGRWARVPLTALESPGTTRAPAWRHYDWIEWHKDGADYRLNIGRSYANRGRLTGHVVDIEGEFRGR